MRITSNNHDLSLDIIFSKYFRTGEGQRAPIHHKRVAAMGVTNYHNLSSFPATGKPRT